MKDIIDFIKNEFEIILLVILIILCYIYFDDFGKDRCEQLYDAGKITYRQMNQCQIDNDYF